MDANEKLTLENVFERLGNQLELVNMFLKYDEDSGVYRVMRLMLEGLEHVTPPFDPD